ncbi:MAG: hypothetical protein KME14_03235 [Tildeniella torsiva UHER 1998/13D]|jgi:hypothetical protein|nr:hypothetical protein [Tildeniella torsiva UHER 1998/13D]
MLYEEIASGIAESLAEKATESVREKAQDALLEKAQSKTRLENKTYEEWQDLIFTIAFTGNFPPEDKLDILDRQLSQTNQRIDVLEERVFALSELIESRVKYLHSNILTTSESNLLLKVTLEDNFFEYELPRMHRPFLGRTDLKTPQEIAHQHAQNILQGELIHQESMTSIKSILIQPKASENASLFDIWQKQAMQETEGFTDNKDIDLIVFYQKIEKKFASILLIQLRYMQILLDAYRVHYATPLDSQVRMTPQEFLDWFYKIVFEPEVSGFVDLVEQWLINIFPYPQSPASRVEIPEEIRQVLVQVNYFAGKTLKPIQELVTVFQWNEPLDQQSDQLRSYLNRACAIANLTILSQPNSHTINAVGDNGTTRRSIILRRTPDPALQPNYDGFVSLTVDNSLCQTYHYQQRTVMAKANPEALLGHILIPGDRWRNYQNKAKLLVRLVDSPSGGQQFDAIGLLEFQSIKFLPPEQKGALRGLGLLVGGRWKYYPELLMAKFVPHHTLTDLVPAGSITLDIRDFDTNRVLQRVTAQFTAAEGTSQAVTRRSFTAFMTTGVDVVAWARSPVAV